MFNPFRHRESLTSLTTDQYCCVCSGSLPAGALFLRVAWDECMCVSCIPAEAGPVRSVLGQNRLRSSKWTLRHLLRPPSIRAAERHLKTIESIPGAFGDKGYCYDWEDSANEIYSYYEWPVGQIHRRLRYRFRHCRPVRYLCGDDIRPTSYSYDPYDNDDIPF